MRIVLTENTLVNNVPGNFEKAQTEELQTSNYQLLTYMFAMPLVSVRTTSHSRISRRSVRIIGFFRLVWAVYELDFGACDEGGHGVPSPVCSKLRRPNSISNSSISSYPRPNFVLSCQLKLHPSNIPTPHSGIFFRPSAHQASVIHVIYEHLQTKMRPECGARSSEI